MSDNSLRVVWVYPDLLSTYGDQGNVLVVERRARQRGLDVARLDVRSDQPIPTSGDIYLIGGGEDRPQRLAAERLRRDRHLYQAVNNGAIVFAVCATTRSSATSSSTTSASASRASACST